MRTRKIVGWAVFTAIMTGCVAVLVLAGISMVGCVSATVTAPACDTQSVNLGNAPTLPVGVSATVTLPPAPVTYDFSDALKKVSDVSSGVKATIDSLAITNTGDLDWVRSVSVTIKGSATDGSTPETAFASNQWSDSPGSSLGLNVTMDGDTTLKYLKSGPVTLNFTVSGDVSSGSVAPGTPLTNDANLCLTAQGSVDKSL